MDLPKRYALMLCFGLGGETDILAHTGRKNDATVRYTVFDPISRGL